MQQPRDWRVNQVAEDYQKLSIMELLGLIKTKVTLMDSTTDVVHDMDEAMTLLHDSARIVVAAMVAIQKLVREVKHLREHIEEGEPPRDN